MKDQNKKQKPDYFAEFRPLFHNIVARQKADKELKILRFHFTAPVEEVAQMAKLAKMVVEVGPGEKNEHLSMVPFIMFIIKMFDGIVDKSTEPLLLYFTATEEEYESAVVVLNEIINVRSTMTDYANEWADTLILINLFLKRLRVDNH